MFGNKAMYGFFDYFLVRRGEILFNFAVKRNVGELSKSFLLVKVGAPNDLATAPPVAILVFILLVFMEFLLAFLKKIGKNHTFFAVLKKTKRHYTSHDYSVTDLVTVVTQIFNVLFQQNSNTFSGTDL